MSNRDHHGIDYIEFTAGDLAESKRFYSEAFGWTFNEYGDAYAGIVIDGVERGGLTVGERASGVGPLVVLYSDDLEVTLGCVVAAGGSIVAEPFAFPGGRRFEFLDPNGNRLGVWSEDPGAG